ncbi:MAG TPA: cupin domain-containing protein [Candidatus Cybelea sp.]|jgi:quercetin dioxygenase-like cupin family protein
MKASHAALLPLACILAVGSLGAMAAGQPTIVMPNQAKYGPAPKPYPAEARMAVLSGDPGKAGSQYTVRLELPNETKIAAHTHGDTENVTVIRGTLMVGVGSSFNSSKMLALTPGSYVSIPPETPHYAMAKGETVVQINGIGPASTTLTGQ